MTKRDFIKQRKPTWRRFHWLLEELGRAGGRLNADEMGEFSRLFREVCFDLSTIRSRDWGAGLIEFLNEMVTRGHSAYYRAPPGSLAEVLRFLAFGFPRMVRSNWAYFLLAFALFFVPLGVTWWVVRVSPETVDRILDKGTQESIAEMYATSDKDNPWAVTASNFGDQRSGMAGFYIYNNVGIAFRVWVLGALLGVPTVYVLLYNGILIGAMAGYVCSLSEGHARRFLSFVVTHGAFELTAIAVAGAAGLMLADAILHPGQRSRAEALKALGFQSLQVAMGAGAMLAVAAMIEAFWSPAAFTPEVKYSVGGSLWVIVFAYLAMSGLDLSAPRALDEGSASARKPAHAV